MKLTFSAFANKIVNEELELIQKALVIAHQHYASWGNFDDALKITNENDTWEYSLLNHNFNPNLSDDFFSMVNPRID